MKDPGILIIAAAVIILVGIHFAESLGLVLAPALSLGIAVFCGILLIAGCIVGWRFHHPGKR